MTTTGTGVASRVAAHALAHAGDAIVADLRIGLGYTAALLDDGRLGLAYTLREELAGGCTTHLAPRPLAGGPVAELLPLLGAADPVSLAVGLACANAVTNTTSAEHLAGDVLEHVGLERDDEVAMVGYFAPLLGELRERARSLTIFERIDEPGEELRPAEEAYEHLPRCSVALLTSTAILSGTIDSLLEAARGCREVVLIGPSTPLAAEVFRGTGVTLLSGAVARDAPEILRIVSEAGGMRLFKRHLDKVVLRLG